MLLVEFRFVLLFLQMDIKLIINKDSMILLAFSGNIEALLLFKKSDESERKTLQFDRKLQVQLEYLKRTCSILGSGHYYFARMSMEIDLNLL